jgi:hypothetical protein
MIATQILQTKIEDYNAQIHEISSSFLAAASLEFLKQYFALAPG